MTEACKQVWGWLNMFVKSALGKITFLKTVWVSQPIVSLIWGQSLNMISRVRLASSRKKSLAQQWEESCLRGKSSMLSFNECLRPRPRMLSASIPTCLRIYSLEKGTITFRRCSWPLCNHGNLPKALLDGIRRLVAFHLLKPSCKSLQHLRLPDEIVLPSKQPEKVHCRMDISRNGRVWAAEWCNQLWCLLLLKCLQIHKGRKTGWSAISTWSYKVAILDLRHRKDEWFKAHQDLVKAATKV